MKRKATILLLGLVLATSAAGCNSTAGYRYITNPDGTTRAVPRSYIADSGTLYRAPNGFDGMAIDGTIPPVGEGSSVIRRGNAQNRAARRNVGLGDRGRVISDNTGMAAQ